jgi:hypothetical protein
METYHGVLEGYDETGTEGTHWVLIEDGYSTGDRDAIRYLEEGDHLTIYAVDRAILFDEMIIKDTTTGLVQNPLNPLHKQQIARSFWVHWIQEGWEPDEWATLFLRIPPLRGVLKKQKVEVVSATLLKEDVALIDRISTLRHTTRNALMQEALKQYLAEAQEILRTPEGLAEIMRRIEAHERDHSSSSEL